jgi:hypothetical protein
VNTWLLTHGEGGLIHVRALSLDWQSLIAVVHNMDSPLKCELSVLKAAKWKSCPH